MLLIDASVWISVFRDRSGQIRQQLETLICESAYVAAVAACQALIETPLYALCLLAAEAGKEVCLDECD
jgi:hypothetical protein